MVKNWVGPNIQRLSEQKMEQTRQLFYRDSPFTQEQEGYAYNIYVRRVVSPLVRISISLWKTHNKKLHGITPEEEHQISRDKAIYVATQYLQDTRTKSMLLLSIHISPKKTLQKDE